VISLIRNSDIFTRLL